MQLWMFLAGMLVFAGCQDPACSPCRPGTYPSDPSQSCSTCLPCPDAGADGGPGRASCSQR